MIHLTKCVYAEHLNIAHQPQIQHLISLPRFSVSQANTRILLQYVIVNNNNVVESGNLEKNMKSTQNTGLVRCDCFVCICLTAVPLFP